MDLILAGGADDFYEEVASWEAQKITGVGRCLLINLEKAKTPIQHGKTSKPLSTCYLQI